MDVTGAVRLVGFCPACGNEDVLEAVAGPGAAAVVECRHPECPEKRAVTRLLEDSETEHIVDWQPDGFCIQHPMRERLDGGLFTCDLHVRLSTPRFRTSVEPGRYRVEILQDADRSVLRWVDLGDSDE